ncbi:MAG: hypothetical protein NWE76_09460, partial [Candidatus Bathyarchaeota archaeon]|nr:hypothetical protein [Candidatus Bathyarchaeota archaeon]
NIAKFGSKIKAIGSSNTMVDVFTGYGGKNNAWVPVEGGGPALLVEDATVGKEAPSYTDWGALYKEYARQTEEVACGKRKKDEVYLKFIEEVTEGKLKKHSNLCLVVNALPARDEIKLLLGQEPTHADYILGEEGQFIEECPDEI